MDFELPEDVRNVCDVTRDIVRDLLPYEQQFQQTGEVPGVSGRTRESRDFILLWGDLSGTNPLNAPSQYRFDPDEIEALFVSPGLHAASPDRLQ